MYSKFIEGKIGKVGRGSIVTFLYKQFVNKMINVIGTISRGIIIDNLKRSVIFRLTVDSTQDVAVMD